MFKQLKGIAKNKLTLILILLTIILIGGGVFISQKILARSQTKQITAEQDLIFDPEGPYALLYPRRDGNALVLNIKRTASYDAISYELAYTSEGIDRGVMGDINTGEKKGEYEQEILFGTCSKNVCKYDAGVENGTLTLHIKKGRQSFRMITLWHLQKPDVALGKLVSGDNHLLYQIDPNSPNLALINYSIINDLSAAPKLPNDKVVVGKVYGVNAPVAKSMPGGQVTIELSDKPSSDAKISRFDEGENKWVEFDTKIEGNKLHAKLDNAGIITVLSSKNKK